MLKSAVLSSALMQVRFCISISRTAAQAQVGAAGNSSEETLPPSLFDCHRS